MTIKEVREEYGLTPDTLRYYERVDVIPEVSSIAFEKLDDKIAQQTRVLS